MRQRDYPGSDLVIERTLSPGRNYQQYVASYQSDGLKIFALLTVPNGAKPATGWPVIIFNHGYIPPTVYRTTERYVAYVDAFARNGYIVFKPDYRGFGSSQGTPVSAYGSPNDTVDVLNAVTTMQRYANADPNRIGMWGHSMGGNITLRALVIDPRIKVAVIWAGVNATYRDLLENWHPTGGDRPPPSFSGGWPARAEPGVLGLDLANGLPGRHHRADPAAPWHFRHRGATAVFADISQRSSSGRQTGGVLHLRRRRPQHLTGLHAGDGPIGGLLRPPSKDIAVGCPIVPYCSYVLQSPPPCARSMIDLR